MNRRVLTLALSMTALPPLTALSDGGTQIDATHEHQTIQAIVNQWFTETSQARRLLRGKQTALASTLSFQATLEAQFQAMLTATVAQWTPTSTLTPSSTPTPSQPFTPDTD